ncbi:hypothetical protein QMK19_29555 [Streptomyces sp. H10-C2]|uniref:hypothetical protein n=1 Tax=unclassified Streptomyces TaxID=2593676 RepID=UPI0024BB6748|nr:MULTISPECIES: hypothetical protein [unclassified Streptomyces]MDJ0344323.1 hypothetical protein [Streptomyces sp. PH10-H1]MDJ0373692.1 hypothetical protein [Streptomyces sp. H10-C2]
MFRETCPSRHRLCLRAPPRFRRDGSRRGFGPGAGPGANPGPAASFDPATNSVAAYRYPGDPAQRLDHARLRNGHARPAHWNNRVVPEHSPKWSVTSWFTTYSYTDYSDHYPLVAGDV